MSRHDRMPDPGSYADSSFEDDGEATIPLGVTTASTRGEDDKLSDAQNFWVLPDEAAAQLRAKDDRTSDWVRTGAFVLATFILSATAGLVGLKYGSDHGDNTASQRGSTPHVTLSYSPTAAGTAHPHPKATSNASPTAPTRPRPTSTPKPPTPTPTTPAVQQGPQWEMTVVSLDDGVPEDTAVVVKCTTGKSYQLQEGGQYPAQDFANPNDPKLPKC